MFGHRTVVAMVQENSFARNSLSQVEYFGTSHWRKFVLRAELTNVSACGEFTPCRLQSFALLDSQPSNAFFRLVAWFLDPGHDNNQCERRFGKLATVGKMA